MHVFAGLARAPSADFLSRFVHYEFLAPVVTIWIYNIQTVGNNSPNFYYFVAFLAAPVLFFFSITGISIGNFIFS